MWSALEKRSRYSTHLGVHIECDMAGGPALERERGGTYDTDIDITVMRGELMELRQ